MYLNITYLFYHIMNDLNNLQLNLTIKRELFIAVQDDELRNLYIKQADKHNNTSNLFKDSGFDLYVPDTIHSCSELTYINPEVIPCFITINHNVVGALFQNTYNNGSLIHSTPMGFCLYPRSSISKSHLRLANSVGVIDAGYRGNIIAKFDFIHNQDSHDTIIYKNERYVQICCGDLIPFDFIHVVKSLDDVKIQTLGGSNTQRGTGGFGSTGI